MSLGFLLPLVRDCTLELLKIVVYQLFEFTVFWSKNFSVSDSW